MRFYAAKHILIRKKPYLCIENKRKQVVKTNQKVSRDGSPEKKVFKVLTKKRKGNNYEKGKKHFSQNR